MMEHKNGSHVVFMPYSCKQVMHLKCYFRISQYCDYSIAKPTFLLYDAQLHTLHFFPLIQYFKTEVLLFP